VCLEKAAGRVKKLPAMSKNGFFEAHNQVKSVSFAGFVSF
jgi:hypothetical protein